MDERLPDSDSLVRGTSDRREFLTSVAALTAGVAGMLTTANEVAAEAAGQVSTGKPRRVDFHHHYQSPEWTKYANSYGVRVPQFEREPVSGTPWTPARGIEAMDKAGTDLAFTSAATYYTKTGLIINGGGTPRTGDTPRRLGRETNDYGARVAADSKGRFRLLAVLPLPDIDSSLKEIDYAYTTLKVAGLCLPSSVGGRAYLGNPKWAPILEEMNVRKAVVHVHPAEPDWSIDLEPGVTPPAVWYGVDTTVAIVSLLVNNSVKKYPNIRWIFSHAGGAMPYLAGRIIGGRGRLLNETPKPGDRLYDIRTFYYDTAQSTNSVTMPALEKVVTSSQVVFGSDYPWSTIVDHVEGLQHSDLTADQIRALDRENGLRLFPE